MTAGIAREEINLVDETSVGARDLLERFGKEILEKSFPPEQYLASSFVGEGTINEPLLIACGPDGSILGGACGEHYPESNTLLLAYLAVREELRGSGIGSFLMEAIRDRWLHPGTLAVLETEDPRHHGVRQDYGDPTARIRLYARFGVKALAIPYFQPRLAPQLPRSYHLLLCALVIPEDSRTGEGVAGGVIERFLREYFTVCEGEAVLKDKELEWLLASCRVPQIQLIPLDDLEHIPDPEPPSLSSR